MRELIDRLNKFAETKTGKIVLAGTLVLTIAFIGLILMNMLNQPSSVAKRVAAVEPVTETREDSTTEAVNNQELQESASFESGFEVFSTEILRNPFEAIETTPTTDSTQVVNVEDASTQAKPLSVAGIKYIDASLKVDVIYDGTLKTMAIGDTVGPYLLIQVNENSAKFLFGDSPVTLMVGQTYNP